MTDEPSTRWRRFRRDLGRSYRLAAWRARIAWRRAWWSLRLWSDTARRVSFVLAGLGVGWAVSRISPEISADSLAHCLVAEGVMAGGTIAIVFAISVFLLQSSSDLYSSPNLDSYIHDWREKLIYSAVILITICLIGAGLLLGGMANISRAGVSAVAFLSLGSVGVVFALIDWQYSNVRRKINPLRAILFLETHATQFIARVQRDAEQMAGIVQAGDGLSRRVALAGVYTRLLRPHFAELEGQLARLTDISVRLGERREIETCKRSLAASVHVVQRYLEARATSSLITPSSVSPFAMDSDSGGFVARSLERLNGVSERFLRDGDEEIVLHMLDLYGPLGRTAAQMRFIGPGNDNPVFALVAAYAGLLVEAGERVHNVEVVFRSAYLIRELAKIALEEGLHTTFLVLLEQTKKAASFGMVNRELVIVQRYADVVANLLPDIYSSQVPNRQLLGDAILEQLTGMAATMAMMSATGAIPNDFNWQTTITRPVDHVPEVVTAVVHVYEKSASSEARRPLRYDLTNLFERINRHWRSLADQLRNADGILVGSVGRALFNINRLICYLMQHSDFADERGELAKRLSWNIHLPTFFPHHAAHFDGGSQGFRELVECVARTGALCASLGDAEGLVRDCAKAIQELAKECLAKTERRYGFDEPRTMEKACYLGVLALKRGWLEVFKEVRAGIQDFEVRLSAKYLSDVPEGVDPRNHDVIGLPHHDQLLREVLRWRREVWERRTPALPEDSESMFADLVRVIDIDRFVLEVWRVTISGSQIQRELQLARARVCAALEALVEKRGRGSAC